MNALTDWPRNRLLLALPSRNLKRLTPEFEHIRCEREQVLMDADSSLDYVFFPERGVVSVVAVYADGSVIELATIGREGCTGTSLPLTQEFLSQMLGVRRTTVTLIARALQEAGLISYRRGQIVILDRAGLEEAACECYQIIQHETLPEIIGVKLASP
jgi:CRP-like cAMP-binding protein